jgi:hypothetical protein
LTSLLDEVGAITEGKIHIIVWGGQLMPASTRNVGCAGAMPDRQAVFMSPILRMPNSNMVGCLPGVAAGVPESSNTLGLIMIHEIIHVVGGVDNEAPDADGGYHISGDPFDLMGGSAGVVRLDPNRRNYWSHGNPSLVDVSLSPFFDDSPSPMSARTFAVSEREWWMELPVGWSPLSPVEPTDGIASSPASSNISTAAEADCPVASDEVAAVFEGRLPLGSNVANEPVGLIWAKSPARCVVARVSSDSQGWFEIELPLDSHVDASWEEGGGYCVVWDENGDGRFDSFSSEPLNCTSEVARDSVVRIDVKR